MGWWGIGILGRMILHGCMDACRTTSFSLSTKSEFRNPKQIQNPNIQNSKQKHHYTVLSSSFCFGHLHFGHSNLFRISCFEFRIFKGALGILRVWRTLAGGSPRTNQWQFYQSPPHRFTTHHPFSHYPNTSFPQLSKSSIPTFHHSNQFVYFIWQYIINSV